MPTYRVKTNDKEFTVTVTDEPSGGASVTVEGQTFQVERVAAEGVARSRPAQTAAAPAKPAAAPPKPSAAPAGSGSILSPIPGKIVAVLTKVGEPVEVNQVVLKIEAMKMENEIVTPVAGTVREIHVSEGTEADEGQLLMVIG